MDGATIRKYLVDVLQPMLKDEKRLFILNVGERAIAHRFACRLTDVFGPLKWDVDCEYNRDGLDGRKVFDQLSYIMHKRADELAKVTARGPEALATHLANAKPISVFPDMIRARQSSRHRNQEIKQ